MLNFNSLIIFSDQPKKLGEFYQQVFQVKPEWEEGEWIGFTIGSGSIAIGPHDKVHGKNKTPERMMFNLETNEVQSEFERIQKFGAIVVAKPYHPMEDEKSWVATFADPDGNYFQLTTPFN